MSAPSRFCDKCQAIQFNDAEWGGFAALDDDGRSVVKFDKGFRPRRFEIGLKIEDIYPSFPFLSGSAADGCDCCGMLKHSVLKAFVGNGFDDSREEKFRLSAEYCWTQYGKDSLDYLQINVDIVKDEGQSPHRISVAHFVQSDRHDSTARWLNLEVIEPEIMTPDTVSWIHSSLQSCQKCEALSRDQFIPTRLVQVDCDPPRLVEMDQSTILSFGVERIKYAALSYCWGPPEEATLQLKTERGSLHSRLSGFLESETTGALRDAITVCRALSISFLWVDALCILQGDLQDWQRESSLMGQIYSNSLLTICALSSSSCIEGFLDRRVALAVPFRSRVTPDVESTFNLTPVMRTDFLRSYLPPYRYLGADRDSSLWDSRGWTLLERTMSARMLMFGQSRLHILCSHKWQTQGQRARSDKLFFQHREIQSDIDLDDICGMWYVSAVPEYSARSLTYMTDRFPAISGLAKAFNEKLQDEYVAGLWKRRMHEGLYWHCDYEQTRHLSWPKLLDELMNAPTYVAPSWSWANRPRYSVEFGVFGWGGRRNAIFINDFREHGSITPRVTLASTNPYGQVSSAVLQITTKVVGIRDDIVFGSSDPYDRVGHAYVGSRGQFYALCRFDWGLGPDGRQLKSIPPDNLMLMLLLSAGDMNPRSALPAAAATAGLDAAPKPDSGEDVALVSGLIIYAIPNTSNFLRVGSFKSHTGQGGGMRIFDGCEPTTINLI